MKRFILFIVLSGSLASVYAQDKCKYDFDKTDAFSGKKQKGNSAILAGFGPAAFRMIFQAEEKKYLLGVYILLGGKNENYVEKGDTLSIAFDDGEFLHVRAIERYLPTYYASTTVTTTYQPLYAVTEDQLKKLSAVGIKATMLKLGSLPLVIDKVAPKNAEKVKKAAACILL